MWHTSQLFKGIHYLCICRNIDTLFEKKTEISIVHATIVVYANDDDIRFQSAAFQESHQKQVERVQFRFKFRHLQIL